MSVHPKKILFLVPYPEGKAPSQRFRFEFFLPLLREHHYQVRISSFFSPGSWDILYSKGNLVGKIAGTFLGYLRRVRDIFTSLSYDYVFIHREATPMGPPFVEWIIGRLFRKKIIYDFDDAIWLSSDTANRIASMLKMRSKVRSITRYSHTISCGNAFLEKWAAQFNNNTALIPTVVDTDNGHDRIQNQHSDSINIGWTGSHTTMPYLESIVPVLRELEKKFKFKFYVISNAQPTWEIDSLEFVKWKKESEIDDLLKFHIGIMPLENDAWSEGKCGFKAIQYMALGMPALVTPVGVNTAIVDHGINGFICNIPEDWYKYLETLLAEESLRVEMGRNARKKIEEHYSIRSIQTNFLALFSD